MLTTTKIKMLVRQSGSGVLHSSVVLGIVLGFGFSASAAPSARENAVRKRVSEREAETKEKRQERVAKTEERIQTGRVEDVQHASTAVISKFTGGKINSLQLDTARKSSYTIEVPGRSANSSKVVEVKLNDMVENLAKNIETLESVRAGLLSPNQAAIHKQKLELAEQTAKLLILGAKRYQGSDANLVLARDAYARQIETAIKMTGRENTAKLAEIKEHQEFIEAIVAEKMKNPNLTDAEATARGVEVAYKESFIKRCNDGSCKVPSEDVLTAGAKNRLKELKECI